MNQWELSELKWHKWGDNTGFHSNSIFLQTKNIWEQIIRGRFCFMFFNLLIQKWFKQTTSQSTDKKRKWTELIVMMRSDETQKSMGVTANTCVPWTQLCQNLIFPFLAYDKSIKDWVEAPDNLFLIPFPLFLAQR